ncbi:MAG: DUF169 domain-containing protein [Thermoanaerobaculaceae bacterium]
MPPTSEGLDRLKGALRLTTPIVALYDCDPATDLGPLVEAKGRACCFAYYQRWVAGETLVVRRGDDSFSAPRNGCPGMQRALGFVEAYPPWMANFLTDGANGAPMGEGLKASPRLAQEFLDRARPPQPRGDTMLMGPLRLERWADVRTVTFFADPDRLAALMTLASFWSGRDDEIAAPFSSGCGPDVARGRQPGARPGGSRVHGHRHAPLPAARDPQPHRVAGPLRAHADVPRHRVPQARLVG